MTEPHAKVATIRISVGEGDERSMEEFIQQAKDALQRLSKNVTILSEYYLIDGQPIRPNGVHALTGEKPPEPKKKTTKKKTTKKTTLRGNKRYEWMTNDQMDEAEASDDPIATANKMLKGIEGDGADQVDPEPWCNHDAPHLLPGDTCECGETVPEPTCSTCNQPWGENPACDTCTKSQADVIAQTASKEEIVRDLAKRTLSMRKA